MMQSDSTSAPKPGPARRAAGPPVHEATYRRLRDAVLFGELAPGQAVTINGLTAMLGVSATPAREAIRRLTAEGALVFQDNRRVSVPVLDAHSIDQVRTARLALEPELARRAALRIDAATVATLEAVDEALDAAMRRHDVPAYLRLNHSFHARLYAAADAPILSALVESLWLRFGPSMRRVLDEFETLRPRDMHKVALAALKAGDPAALAAAVADDARQGMDLLAASLTARRPPAGNAPAARPEPAGSVAAGRESG